MLFRLPSRTLVAPVALALAACVTVPPTAQPTRTAVAPSATAPATRTAELPSPSPSPTRGPTPTPRPTRTPTTAPTATPTPSAAELAELQKFDRPEDFLPAGGPGGTQWDQPYRALIQTNESAVSKGLPSHPEAVEQIKGDAAQSAEQLRQHLGYVLYIKHFSQSYRPEEATQALRQLYTDLVAMAFGQPYIAAQAVLPFEGDPRLSILRDVVYGPDNAELQSLDAYLIQGERPSPVIVELHGGGWRRGHKSQFELYADGLVELLIDQGFSVISLNYRLTPNDYYPAQVQDVQRALQFIRAHAAEWRIDPERMAAMGGSAGAHLSAWIALHDDLADFNSADLLAQQSTRLSCFVDMWGPMDLTRVRPAELAQSGLRGADFARAFANFFATTPELYNRTPDTQLLIRDASPLFYITPDDPPAMIIHNAPAELSGTDHPPAPETINDPHSPWFGVMLADALEAAGVKVVRYIGPEVGKDADKDAEAIAAFLQECLGGSAAPR